MTNNQHRPEAPVRAPDNPMPDDPGDGIRRPDRRGGDDEATAARKPAADEEQEQTAIEAFGDEGAGIAAKE